VSRPAGAARAARGLQQEGSFGTFDFTTLMLQLTTGLTYLACVSLVVDLIAQYVIPQRELFTETKYQICDYRDTPARPSAEPDTTATQRASYDLDGMRAPLNVS
jgi:hypothetical protein